MSNLFLDVSRAGLRPRDDGKDPAPRDPNQHLLADLPRCENCQMPDQVLWAPSPLKTSEI
jgi:hypothetical protein